MSIILMPFFGLVGPILPFFGVIVSVISLILANRYQAKHSRSMAITGLITSFASWVILVGWMVHSKNEKHKEYGQLACLSNSKQIGLAMRLYADDNDGMFPPTIKWQRHLLKYAYRETVFQCPIAKDAKYSYGMNIQIGSVSERKLANPTQTVAAFDCSLPMTSASGGREAVDFRHLVHGYQGIANIIFTDGHAQAATATKADSPNLMPIDKVRWKP
ncbi:MAG: hypothetical protein ACYC1M_18775 [Armatimonadota bacterium]